MYNTIKNRLNLLIFYLIPIRSYFFKGEAYERSHFKEKTDTHLGNKAAQLLQMRYYTNL